MLKLSHLWHSRVLHTGTSVLIILSSKWQLLSPPERGPTPSEAAIPEANPLHGSGSPRKTRLTWFYSETTLYSHREETEQGELREWTWVSPWPAGHLPQLTQGDDLHAPFLCCGWRTPFPPLPSPTPVKGCSRQLAMCSLTAWSSRTEEHILSLKQRRTFPHRSRSPHGLWGLLGSR